MFYGRASLVKKARNIHSIIFKLNCLAYSLGMQGTVYRLPTVSIAMAPQILQLSWIPEVIYTAALFLLLSKRDQSIFGAEELRDNCWNTIFSYSPVDCLLPHEKMQFVDSTTFWRIIFINNVYTAQIALYPHEPLVPPHRPSGVNTELKRREMG